MSGRIRVYRVALCDVCGRERELPARGLCCACHRRRLRAEHQIQRMKDSHLGEVQAARAALRQYWSDWLNSRHMRAAEARFAARQLETYFATEWSGRCGRPLLRGVA